jgi:hypothetical protein
MEGAAANLKTFLQPENTAEIIVQAMERCRLGEISSVIMKVGEIPVFC